MNIKHAEFKRILERAGKPCADVEVLAEGNDRQLVAIFTESRDQDFDLAMILRKDTDLDADWYDNDLHSAYEDVTESLFENAAGETVWKLREAFKEAILNYGSIREQIGKHLKESNPVKA